MKKIISILLILVVVFALVGCGKKGLDKDFKMIGDKVAETDADFSNYKEILSDYKGAEYITDMEDHPTESMKYAVTPSIKIGDYFCRAFLGNGTDMNFLSIHFYPEDNDLTINELERNIMLDLEMAYPLLKGYDAVTDGEIRITATRPKDPDRVVVGFIKYFD
ncbi:MAG: hypothetical protein GX217_08635 [Clostridiaceae bacterium]|nr:hypothetical protein [Clostridiaceae bacterium]